MWDGRNLDPKMVNIAAAVFFIFATFFSTLPSPAYSSSAETYYSIGQKYMEEGNFDMAALGFAKAVELAPDWPEAHNALGEAYVQILRFRDAVEHFDKAVELKPDYNKAKLNRRRTMMSVERYEPMEKSRLNRWHKVAILGGVTVAIAFISALVVHLISS